MEDAKIPNWNLISPIPLTALVFGSDYTPAKVTLTSPNQFSMIK